MWTFVDTISLSKNSRLRKQASRRRRKLSRICLQIGDRNALFRIRDARLYRQKFSTFEDYCRERWAMSRPQAYRLIDAANVAKNLSPIGDNPPSYESQVQPLARLEPEQQKQAWQIASAISPNPTAAVVEQVAQTIERASVTTVTPSSISGAGKPSKPSGYLKARAHNG